MIRATKEHSVHCNRILTHLSREHLEQRDGVMIRATKEHSVHSVHAEPSKPRSGMANRSRRDHLACETRSRRISALKRGDSKEREQTRALFHRKTRETRR